MSNRQRGELQGSFTIRSYRDKASTVAEARAGHARGRLEGRVGQSGPSLGKVGAQGKALGFAANAGQGPVGLSGVDHDR